MHKRLNEFEDMWGERCADETKLSRVRVASVQRNRIVVSEFFFHVLQTIWYLYFQRSICAPTVLGNLGHL